MSDPVKCPNCGNVMTAETYSPAITWMSGLPYYECQACGMLLSRHGCKSHDELARTAGSIKGVEVVGCRPAVVKCPVCGDRLHLPWDVGAEFDTLTCRGCDSVWPVGWLQDKALETMDKQEKDNGQEKQDKEAGHMAMKINPDKLTNAKWLVKYTQYVNPDLLQGVKWCLEHGFGTSGLYPGMPGYVRPRECMLYGHIGQGFMKFVVKMHGRERTDGTLEWNASVHGSMDTQLDAALNLSGVCNRVYSDKSPDKALMQLVPVLRKLDKIGDKLKEAVGKATIEVMEIKQEGDV